MFVRISMTTIATDLNSPAAAGRPPGRDTSVMTARTRAASSASCPRLSPVRVSYRNGSSMEIPVFWRHEIPWQEPFLYSAARRNEEIHRQSVEMWTKDGLESSVNACPRIGKPIAYELASGPYFLGLHQMHTVMSGLLSWRRQRRRAHDPDTLIKAF